MGAAAAWPRWSDTEGEVTMGPSELPPIAALLCTLWNVDEPLAKRWWGAIARAKWFEVSQWRQALLVLERVGDGEEAMYNLLTPAKVVRMCELLVQEQVLGRRDASAFEDALLAVTDSAGQWK
jgi:hypothetical protein